MASEVIDWEITDRRYTKVFLELCRDTHHIILKNGFIYFGCDFEFRIPVERYEQIMFN